MCVGPEAPHRELDGVRLAKHDHPGADQSLGERRGDRRHAVGPYLGPSGGDATFEIDEILQRDRHTVERPHAMTGADRLVRRLGGQARFRIIHGDERVKRRVVLLDPVQQRFDGVHRRENTRAERARQLGDSGPHGIDSAHATTPPPRDRNTGVDALLRADHVSRKRHTTRKNGPDGDYRFLPAIPVFLLDPVRERVHRDGVALGRQGTPRARGDMDYVRIRGRSRPRCRR